MDMRAFPKMIQINSKIIPNPQILQWAQWFSPYKFEVKHLKGKYNIMAYFLSRPETFLRRFRTVPDKEQKKPVAKLLRLQTNDWWMEEGYSRPSSTPSTSA
ncbi:hypothetical protein KY290_027601 [Solanum tuberosum]|uniref:Uncharacterized protein n=1 Tax=Solanum tuberosum TaxID=4113 RepID=A0ABQ7UG15_SOLTU|nr:hypothetical protein KY285_026557 [Solanum tuberosum]KAH0748369.1 hypothetical protein KY290_027601 [Solanum tuberosum]